MGRYDAILVLGGGVREGGILPPWAAARFDLALELETGEPIACLSAATVHRPPPLENGFPIAESVAGARYLMSRGIAPERIRIENASYDTVGNAYLTKLLFVDPAGWRRLLVITSEFHMPRSQAVFEWIFGFEADRYELTFRASPDIGVDDADRDYRLSQEARNVQLLKEKMATFTSLSAVHDWFWTGHRAYSAEGLREPRMPSDPRLQAAY